MKRFLWIAIIATVCLTGCQLHKVPRPADFTLFYSGADLNQAFALAYGQSRVATRPYRTDDVDTILTYRPQALIGTESQFFLVAQAENKLDCHACSSGIAITTFTKIAGRPGKIVADLPFTEGGRGFAEGAKWHIDARFTDNPALLVEGGYSGGCSDTGVQIIELTPNGAKVRTDFIQLTREDDPADASAPHFTSRILSVIRGRGFIVQYSGTYQKTVTYTLRNGRFTPDVDSSDAFC